MHVARSYFFQHQLREALRSKTLQTANKRLDLRGISERTVDRFTLTKILRRLNN